MVKKSNSAKILGQMVCLSQKFIITFIKKNCLKIPSCLVIVMHDKWMKEWFSKLFIHTLKLHNYSSQCSSCAFFREIQEKLSWVIETIKRDNKTRQVQPTLLWILVTHCMSLQMQKQFSLFSLVQEIFKEKAVGSEPPLPPLSLQI